MLQGVFNIARHRVHAVTSRRPFALQARVLSERSIQRHRTYDSAAETSTKRHSLSTLNPSQSAVAQEVLDVSGESEIILSCRGRTDGSVSLWYDTDRSFPPDTRGVFYYLPAQRRRHIRFRLCDNIADFSRGTDLLQKDGLNWTLSLDSMSKKVGYRPLLDMIAEEHPSSVSDIDGALLKRRNIMTLAPQHLAAQGQMVWDISNYKTLKPYFPSLDGVPQCAVLYTKIARFPADTKGVFYYKQSTTAPEAIGELRFRLCSDVASFAAGSDLLAASGLPWCISSDQIFSASTYAAIREQLLHEGLVKEPFPIYPESSSTPIICKLKQPFVVDLSQQGLRFRFKFVTGDTSDPVVITLFSKKSGSFTGRAIVHFESYPSVYLRGRTITKDPVFALRFLEFLTPVEVKSMESGMQRPVVGKLFMRPYGSVTVPWGYAPLDEILFRQLSKLKS